MGHKTHPYGFRLGIIKDWKAHWYAQNGSSYRNLLNQDLRLRESIKDEYKAFSDAGIAKVEIDRGAQDSVINIHSARPGILIGRDGERVKNLRAKLEAIAGSRIQLNIVEIEQPETNAYLVAENIAQQLVKRISFRRAMKRAMQSALRLGAKGIRVCLAGRLAGNEIARTEWLREGSIPSHTLRADIDYAEAEALTTYGIIGIKVWIYKGEIFTKEFSQERNKK